MHKVEVYLVNAFTIAGQGGNLAGVVLNRNHLTRQQKQYIAAQVGVSETAFVTVSDNTDIQVSFFTPTDEVDFCGHATLAVFWLLHHFGSISPGSYQQQTKIGRLAVEVLHDGEIIMDQVAPEWLGQFTAREVAPILNIAEHLILQTELPVNILSTGLPDVMVPVTSGVLNNLNIKVDAMSEFCRRYDLIGFHVFELASERDFYTAYCRNFAPVVGILEESATGSASGALACYLEQYLGITESVFLQGEAMHCPSRVSAKVTKTNGSVTRVQVGGEGNYFSEVAIDLKGI